MLVSKATASSPFADARLHLLDRSNPGGPRGTSRQEVLGLVENRREDQAALLVDTNIDLAAGPA